MSIELARNDLANFSDTPSEPHVHLWWGILNFCWIMLETMIYIICLHKSQNPRTSNCQSLKGEQQKEANMGSNMTRDCQEKGKQEKIALKPLVETWLQSVFILSLINLEDGDHPCQQQQKPARIPLPMIRAFYLPLCFKTNF